MKLLKQTLSLMVAAAAVCASAYKKEPNFLNAMRNGGMTQIILHVRDDQGEPVAGTEVKVSMGMTFAEKSYDINGRTDTGGMFVVKGKTTGNEIGISLSKPGYYDSTCKLCYIKMGEENDVRDGKWQPYPMERTVMLRKIRNPIALSRQVKTLVLHTTNQWVGVDMMVGDFIRPFGRGEVSDFQVKVQWDGLIDLKSMLCTADVQFPDPLAGGYFAAKCSESSFPYEYVANTNAEYQPHIYVQNRKGDFYSSHKPFDKRATFVMRSRCRVDEKGRLVAANYGCIRRLDVTPGDWGNGVNVVLDTVFNQTPNDANLEDDELSQRYMRLRDRQ